MVTMTLGVADIINKEALGIRSIQVGVGRKDVPLMLYQLKNMQNE